MPGTPVVLIASPCLQFQLLLYHIFCLYTQTIVTWYTNQYSDFYELWKTIMLYARAAESTPIFGTRQAHSETDRHTVNYSLYPDVAIETLHGCWKRSNVPCLRCYREAQEPIKFFDIGCCHGSPTVHIERYRYTARIQRYAFKVIEQTNFIYNGFNSVYTNEINILR